MEIVTGNRSGLWGDGDSSGTLTEDQATPANPVPGISGTARFQRPTGSASLGVRELRVIAAPAKGRQHVIGSESALLPAARSL
jgi:hypothetical protein